jgi:ketosteroid isomerase-like protein
MPPADVDAAKRLYEAIEKQDREALEQLLEDDIEWIVSPNLPWGGRRHGFDEVAEGLEVLRKSVKSAKFERDEFVDVGDGEVIALGRLCGEGALTGAPFEAEFAHHIRVDDGRVARFHVYVDTAEILKALAEPPAD